MAVFSDNSISHDVTLDVNFRAWIQKIHDGLSAVGLVQTSDTGQITIASATNPGVFSDAGYEVWRFNDAEQGAEPVFIKLIYGVGGNVRRPRLGLRVGRGTNGAGTLTTTGGLTTASPGTNDSGNGVIHIAHLDGGLVIYTSVDPTATGSDRAIMLFVERLRDENGDVIAGGLGYVNLADFDQGGPTGKTLIAGTWGSSLSSFTLDFASRTIGGKIVFGGLRPIGYPAAPLKIVKLGLVDPIDSGDSGQIDGTTYKRPSANSNTWSTIFNSLSSNFLVLVAE